MSALHNREMRMRKPRAHLDYCNLVDEWRVILQHPLSREVKQAECTALLRNFIDRIARKRICGSDQPLRFYADMLVLQQLLQPGLTMDELSEVAIWPAYRLVNDWLKEHSLSDRRRR